MFPSVLGGGVSLRLFRYALHSASASLPRSPTTDRSRECNLAGNFVEWKRGGGDRNLTGE